jgi:hypothetical protein
MDGRVPMNRTGRGRGPPPVNQTAAHAKIAV